MLGLATSEIIALFLLLLTSSGILLFEFLLGLLIGVLGIFMYLMRTRGLLNYFFLPWTSYSLTFSSISKEPTRLVMSNFRLLCFREIAKSI
jgi:hypothetical protein